MKKFLKDNFLGCALAMGLVGCMTGVALAEQCPPTATYLGPGGFVRCQLVLAIYDEEGGIVDCLYDDCVPILAE